MKETWELFLQEESGMQEGDILIIVRKYASQVIIKGFCNTCVSKTVQTDLDAYVEVHASLLIDGVNVCTKLTFKHMSPLTENKEGEAATCE